MNGDEQDGPPATPLWVKVFGIVALVVLLALVAVLLLGGEHGPGQHGPAGAGRIGPW